jgi:hypothetical protein
MDMRRLIAVTMVIAVLLAGISGGLGIACCPNGGEDDGDGNGDNGQTTITPIDSPETPARGYFKGVVPWPAEGQNPGDAYEQAAQYAEFTNVWESGVGCTDFREYAEKLAEGLHMDQLIRGNGMFPVIGFSFISKDPESGLLIVKTSEGLEGATLSDAEWRSAYKQEVLDGVEAVKPLYLIVGNEVNRWYEQYGVGGENGFDQFVSLYEDIYDAVKERSPETYVFCVFSREIVDELREADLEALTLFDPDKLDILVFTSYPHSVRTDAEGEMLQDPHNHPSDIPDDYYSRVFDKIDMADKPFGFSEISWPAAEFYGGEQGQVDLLDEALGRLTVDQGIDLHLFAWAFLHDLRETDDTGLIKRDGTERLVYDAWKEL